MQFSVREATRAEIDSLRASLAPGEWHLEARLTTPADHRVVCATVDGEIVGSVIVSLAEADEPEVRKWLPDTPILFRMHVDEQYRCLGIGSAMMGFAEELLRGLGEKSVLFGVDVSNQRARRLYQALGYTADQQLAGLGDDGEPYDILVKAL